MDDGANETTLEIKYPGMEMLHTYTLIIHVDEAYTNPYVATDGMASFKYEASLIRWVKLTEGVFKWNQGEFAERARLFPLPGRAQRLGRVLDQEDVGAQRLTDLVQALGVRAFLVADHNHTVRSSGK